LLPVHSGGHAAYQNFVTENLRKHYPDPCSLSRSTRDIIERFWALDLSFTDEFLAASILSLVSNQGLLPACSVPTFYLLISRWIPLPTGLPSCRKNHIQPFIVLNEKRGIHVKYKMILPLAKTVFLSVRLVVR